MESILDYISKTDVGNKLQFPNMWCALRSSCKCQLTIVDHHCSKHYEILVLSSAKKNTYKNINKVHAPQFLLQGKLHSAHESQHFRPLWFFVRTTLTKTQFGSKRWLSCGEQSFSGTRIRGLWTLFPLFTSYRSLAPALFIWLRVYFLFLPFVIRSQLKSGS